MTDQELMQASDEDRAFYTKCTQGLPGLSGFSGTGYDAEGLRIPWGSGPHNIQAYREILEMIKPKNILEIGFNLGYATALFLNLCDAQIVSIDISDKEETIAASDLLYNKFGNRFDFYHGDSTKISKSILEAWTNKFDTIFIDGNHLEEFVTSDIQLAISLQIKNIVLDDWLPQFGPGVQIAAAKFPLKLIKVFGNTALMEV